MKIIDRNYTAKIFLDQPNRDLGKEGHPSPGEGKEKGYKKIRVVLADDHPRIREGIRSLLENTQDIEIVGEASDGAEALQLVEELCPDVLLLDMEMPRMNGSQVIARLQQKNSPVKILVLSAYDDSQMRLGVLQSGAAGCLTKEDAPEILAVAVRGVVRGKRKSAWVTYGSNPV